MSELQHTVHYVGSYPEVRADTEADTTYLTMQEMLMQGGQALRTLTDGETGPRQNWVVGQIDSYGNNPAFVQTREGAWSGYDDCPEYAVAAGHTLEPADFNLQYANNARKVRITFDELCDEFGRTDLNLQVGIPSPFDMSLFTFGAIRGMDPALMEAYAAATREQIEHIYSEFHHSVTFQIETPASLSLALLEEELIPPEQLGEQIAEVAATAPEGSRFGVHLCLGDLGNESRGQLETRDASVALIRALTSSWPDGRTLDYVHDPSAAGKNPPVLDREAYAALGRLLLPSDTRYIAGIVHELQSMADQRMVRDMVQRSLPESQQLGIATACGLGRRELSVARILSRRMFLLAK